MGARRAAAAAQGHEAAPSTLIARVSLPDSGWNPDTRTVTVVAEILAANGTVAQTIELRDVLPLSRSPGAGLVA